ncbi:MAG: hypothetical protein R3C53_19180 [Pirellulaceae bacterium]
MNAREMIRERADVFEVVPVLAKLNDFELEKLTEDFTDEEAIKTGPWIAVHARNQTTLCTLIVGALVLYFQIATRAKHLRFAVKNLMDDIGLGETQIYRCVDAWRGFRQFMDETKTLSQFSSESLKILGAKCSSAEAREKAIELARQGQRITAKRAKQLVTKLGNPLPKSTRRHNWHYQGNAAKVTVSPAEGHSLSDLDAIIQDLQECINKLAAKRYATA